MKKRQRIKDPIHGLIAFDPSNDTDCLAWRLINTPAFQRLRRIGQLGFSSQTFPGATHSRFIHSIGVYYTARQLDRILRHQLGDHYDTDQGQIALIAALLHDLGHGPFSHAFEQFLASIDDDPDWWHHEQWTARIIREDREINAILGHDLAGSIADLLIHPDKTIYTNLVSGQFDADRLDYLLRDQYMTGVDIGAVEREWLLDCLEVAMDDGDHATLALAPKGIRAAESYLLARRNLYRQVYHHKTTRGLEKLFTRLLSRHRDDPRLAKLRPDVAGLTDYLALDDPIIQTMIADYADQGDDLARRLRDRQVFKSVNISLYFDNKLGPGRGADKKHLIDRFEVRLKNQYAKAIASDDLLIDRAVVTPYTGGIMITGFGDRLVDLSEKSALVPALREDTLLRAYSADPDMASEITKLADDFITQSQVPLLA